MIDNAIDNNIVGGNTMPFRQPAKRHKKRKPLPQPKKAPLPPNAVTCQYTGLVRVPQVQEFNDDSAVFLTLSFQPRNHKQRADFETWISRGIIIEISQNGVYWLKGKINKRMYDGKMVYDLAVRELGKAAANAS